MSYRANKIIAAADAANTIRAPGVLGPVWLVSEDDAVERIIDHFWTGVAGRPDDPECTHRWGSSPQCGYMKHEHESVRGERVAPNEYFKF